MVDGLKIPTGESGDAVWENAMYNGWTRDHYVSNVFAYAPNGDFIFAAVNFPGS